LKGKDFLNFSELTPSDLGLILKLSAKFKQNRGHFGTTLLKSRTLALIFEKPSTRTRISFEVAMRELGGDVISLSAGELQLGRGETIEDTARVLSRFLHILMARVYSHDEVIALAAASSIPVINGLSNRYHPVQILADLLTLKEHKGKLGGLKVAWVGDGNNVCTSWLYGAALAGLEFVAATPKGYAPPRGDVKRARIIGGAIGAKISILESPAEAVRNADCVMTDAFVSMGFESEREKRLKAFLPDYRVDKELLSLAKQDAIFEHCLPAHRGEEVTADVIDGPRSVVFDQAENRLHTTKALLSFLLLGEKGVRAMV
jgi:ornithine carbamoyltransferase